MPYETQTSAESAVSRRCLPPQLTVVVPVFDEAGNVQPLVDEIAGVLGPRMRFEIVVVDDGSTDGTSSEIDALDRHYDFVRVLRHPANRGQSAAIRTGVEAAAAPVVTVLDGDGQNDPADIPAMYGHLKCGSADCRMVVGDRRRRHDSALRKLSSRIANGVRARVLDDGIRDTGCGIKVFYRDDFLALPAFDHMHRFLPALIQRDGARVCSVPVNHRPRVRGTSKYGVGNRLWAGIADMLGVLWLRRRSL